MIILGSNATLHVNWPYCGVSRLVMAVDMLHFLSKFRKLYMYAILFFITTACLNVFGGKSLSCTIFWPCTYINFQQWVTLHLCSGLHLMNFLTICHPTLVFVPPLVFGSSEYMPLHSRLGAGQLTHCGSKQQGDIVNGFVLNSLAPGGFDYSLKSINFKLIPTIDILSIFCEIAIRWMPQHPTDH